MNENIIIEFEKGSNTIAYTVLAIELFLTAFQIWVIFTLSAKSMSMYIYKVAKPYGFSFGQEKINQTNKV